MQSELALPSTGSWLPIRPSSNWRWEERILSNSKYAKKRDISSEKRDGAKKRQFTPERGNVDTYETETTGSNWLHPTQQRMERKEDDEYQPDNIFEVRHIFIYALVVHHVHYGRLQK